MSNYYQDIIGLSRPLSKRPKMSVANRAKLFTPFSALRGFDIEILTQEQDRLLVSRELLSADQQEDIRRALNETQPGDWVTVVRFQPAKILGGETLGEYVTLSGAVKKVDDVAQSLVLEGGPVPFGDIHRLLREGAESP